jgi:hypothetical protein
MSDVTLPISPQTSFRMVRILREHIWPGDMVMLRMLEEVIRREAKADQFKRVRRPRLVREA